MFGTRRVGRGPFVALLLSLALLAPACASRPGPAVLETVATKPVAAKKVEVFAVTTRGRLREGTNQFDSVKSETANYARFSISIPPAHKPTAIEWPKGKPDPAKSFAVVGQAVLTKEGFARELAAAEHGSRKVGVFVHGYNLNFQESLFRLAQMSADSNLEGAPILFSWPSHGAYSGYVADKEAATYSRDYLAALLAELARGRGKGDVYVVAHSMGGWLVVEALRQLKLEGRDDVLSRLRVILASPDIDADVFRTQIAVIGRMDPPLTILVSGDDRVLYASSLLNANSQRVGALDITDPRVSEAAVKNGIQLVDISAVENPDSSNHNRYVEVGTLFPVLTSPGRAQSAGQVGAFVFDAAGRTLSSPFRLVSNVLRQ